MNSFDDSPLPEPIPPELREEIDELLDAFERDRQAGGTAPITAFLGTISPALRATVFRILLRAECDYLADTDRLPDVSSYFDRYGEFHAVLREEFRCEDEPQGPRSRSAASLRTEFNPDGSLEAEARQPHLAAAKPAESLDGKSQSGPLAQRTPIGRTRESLRVAIIGGGWAGLAAAVAAVEQGLDVELFEARSRCGGRAGLSLTLPDGREADFCRHLSLGCCVNWLDVIERTGCAELLLKPDGTYRFVSRDGRPHTFCAGRMPSPLHLAPALWARTDLPLSSRWKIGTAIMRLARSSGNTEQSFAAWLAEHGQDSQTIAGFWAPVVLSALGDDAEHVSQAAARQVFVDGLLVSAEAGRMIFVRRTMGDAIEAVVRWLEAKKVVVRQRAAVQSIWPNGNGVTVATEAGSGHFDYAVSAVPWWQAERLIRFPDPSSAHEGARAILRRATELPVGTIAAVHLLYRRRWTKTAHAVLIDRLGQWFFAEADDRAVPPGPAAVAPPAVAGNADAPLSGVNRGQGQSDGRDGTGHYQVVISGLHRLPALTDAELIAKVRGELAALWPDEAQSGFVFGRVARHQRAIFVRAPGVDQKRPSAKAISDRILLAGDWTASGWPATMEGAVRSGRLAVEAILEHLGRPASLLSPQLPRSWLFRLLFG